MKYHLRKGPDYFATQDAFDVAEIERRIRDQEIDPTWEARSEAQRKWTQVSTITSVCADLSKPSPNQEDQQRQSSAHSTQSQTPPPLDPYEVVAEELQRQFIVPGLWTHAYAEADGDEARAKAFYIRYRVTQLGGSSSSKNPSNASPPSSPPPSESHKHYVGVGGWLLFFCVGLTILGPLGTLGRMGNESAEAKRLAASIPNLAEATTTDNVLVIVLLISGFVVGVRLWQTQPSAAKAARTYLVFRLGLGILRCILLISIPDIPPSLSTDYATEIITRVGLYELILFGIWYSYFRISKRVKATFPGNT